MGVDPPYMWGQARSGQPAGRIWPAPTYIGGHPPYIGCVFINYYLLLLLLFIIMGGIFLLWGSPNSRDVLFLEKKGPRQATAGCRRNWFSQKIQNSKNSDKINTIFRKGTRGKMTPQVFSIQWQSPFLISSQH